MKLLILCLFALNFSQAETYLKSNQDSTPPTPHKDSSEVDYKPNDGSARPGNPGTFTSKGPKSNLPETNLEMENHPELKTNQEIQAEEAEFDDEVLK
jgi:hypothetical protein